MAKKIPPDPPAAHKPLSTADKYRYLCPASDNAPTPGTAQLLDTLAFTTSKPVVPDAHDKPKVLAIKPGITAHDVLTYVSSLL